MPKTKQYAVHYTFTGAGTVIVEWTNKDEAAEKAKAKIPGIMPKLRPYSVVVHGSSTEVLQEWHQRVDERQHGRWGGEFEPFDGSTPTVVK